MERKGSPMPNAPSWPDGWEWYKTAPGQYLAQGYAIKRLRYKFWAVSKESVRIGTRPTLGECIELIANRIAPSKPSVRYPAIEVELIGQDGNAALIIGRVTQAMRRAGVSRDELAMFRTEATSGDYDNVLATALRWVSVS